MGMLIDGRLGWLMVAFAALTAFPAPSQAAPRLGIAVLRTEITPEAAALTGLEPVSATNLLLKELIRHDKYDFYNPAELMSALSAKEVTDAAACLKSAGCLPGHLPNLRYSLQSEIAASNQVVFLTLRLRDAGSLAIAHQGRSASFDLSQVRGDLTAQTGAFIEQFDNHPAVITFFMEQQRRPVNLADGTAATVRKEALDDAGGRSGVRALAVAKWTTAGLGAAALATAGVFGYLAKRARDDAGSAPDPATLAARNDDLKRYRLWSNALWITGGVLAAGSVVLFLIDRDDDRSDERLIDRMAVAPAAGPDGVFASAACTF